MAKPLSPEGQRLKDLIDFDKRFYFLFLVLLFLLIRYLTNSFILETIPDFENLEAKGDFMIFHLFNLANYIWTPFSLLWKFTVIAFLFWLGAFMVGYKVPYRELWQFAMISEIVFVLPELIRLFVFLAPDSGATFVVINEYRAFSVLQLLGPENIAEQYHYALATLNIFEVVYGIFWVYGFNMISRRSFKESILVTLVSYFLPLAIWLSWYIMVYRG
jgi:hypothetical protein